MNKKGTQTTIVAVMVGLLGVTIFVLWFIKVLDNSQLTLGLASLAILGSTIGLYLAKDANKSHSDRPNIEPPKTDKPPSAKTTKFRPPGLKVDAVKATMENNDS